MMAGSTLEEQAPIRSWNQKNGWQTVRSWRGYVNEVESMIPQLQRGATDIRIQPEEGGYATIFGTYGNAQDGSPTETQLVSVWNLGGNKIERSGWEAKKVKAMGSRILVTIKRALAAVNDLTTVTDNTYSEMAVLITQAVIKENTVYHDTTGVAQQDALEFFDLLIANAGYFSVPQYVLSNVRIFDGKPTAKISLKNVEKIYTTPSLVAIEQVPVQDLIFELPEGFWQKQEPQARQRFDGKWEVTLEFWHADNYAGVYYDSAT